MSMTKENFYPILDMSIEKSAALMAEIVLLCKASVSNSITLRNRAAQGSHHYFHKVRNGIPRELHDIANKKMGITYQEITSVYPYTKKKLFP